MPSFDGIGDRGAAAVTATTARMGGGGEFLGLFGNEAPDPLSQAAMRRLRARPGYADAVAGCARGVLASYRDQRAPNRILNDRGRVILSILLLDLHHRAEAGDGEATLSRLQALCAELEVCSPGRTAAMIAAMRLFRFVSLAPSPDRRARRLVPSEAFERLTRERWSAILGAVAALLPSLAPFAARMEDRAFMAAFVHAMRDRFVAGYRTGTAVPGILPYGERDGGIMVLLSLHLAAVEAARRGEIGFTVSAAARDFHLSRAHVAGVLRLAGEDGLVTRSGPRDRVIEPTPALGDLVENFFASAFLLHAVALHDAAAAIGPAGMERRMAEPVQGG